MSFDHQRPRALFFGSPAFAMPSLDALDAIAEVVGVICQPDKPAGRGLEMTPPPVKERAMQRGLPVLQPTKLRTGEVGAWARDQRADVALVVAYGRILPRDVLDAPRLGCINVHASLLPKYRGAAPIARALAAGEAETGITLMKLDEGMDTGPTFARVQTTIARDETTGQLSERLAQLGASAVTEWLPRYLKGQCTLQAQDEASATLAPPLSKAEGQIGWSARAGQIHDHVRAMSPWPGAFTSLHGRAIKIHATHVFEERSIAAKPGTVVLADKTRVLVACGVGIVELLLVQLDGRRVMPAAAWAIGRGVAQGDRLG